MAAARRCPAYRLRSPGARARRSAHREEWDCGDRCRETRTASRSGVLVHYNICPSPASPARCGRFQGRLNEERVMSEKQAFLDAWDRESATTLKVLRAFPEGKTGMKPHESCRSANELAWTFVFEGFGGAQ